MTALVARLSDRARRGHARVRDLLETSLARDLALAGVRLALAWVFIYHGAGTLFGAFGGAGMGRASVFFGHVAHLHPATFFAGLSGVIECFGGAAVGLGIFGRLAAAGLVGDMVVAMATVTFGNGIVSTRPGSGYELNLALTGAALAIAVFGTGSFSLDRIGGKLLARARGANHTASRGDQVRQAT